MEDQNILQFLVENREWHSFECKRSAVKPSKLLETTVAFANSEGGVLTIGLEDPSKASGTDRIFGISENRDNVSEYLKLVLKEIDPPIRLLNKFELPVCSKNGANDALLVVVVSKSTDVHSLKNGDTFVRRGNQNVKIGSHEIIRLKYEKGELKFEDELSGIDNLDDMDLEVLNLFKRDIQAKSEDIWQLLKDNGLAEKRRNSYEFTKAGVLIFAKNPSVLLKGKYGIKISHYFGTKSIFSDEPNFIRRPFTIEGPLLKQINLSIKYFRDAIQQSPPKLKDAGFKPSLLIPEWAFQEAVTNAVIHRNYTIQDDIQIRFFDNRIEIESPGSYPGHITVSNILTERFARNPLILRTLNRFDDAPNLDIGEGVNRMFTIMKETNLYDPLYFPPTIKPNSVLLFLFNIERVEYWDTVNNYLAKNYRITNKQGRKILGIHDTLKMSRLLNSWVHEGLLEKIGDNDKKATYYIKPGQDIPKFLFSAKSENWINNIK